MRAAQLKRFKTTNDLMFIEGDVNQTFKTAQFVKGDFRPRFRREPDSIDDEKVRDWYAYGDIDQIQPNLNERYAHVIKYDVPLNIQMKTFTMNRSIKSLIIEPQACLNHQECNPSDQVVILPYLTE